MKTILQDIQETVIQYANIIANVIKVDVEIVDANLVRIAGTGIYKGKINEDMSGEGFVYKEVLHTGQAQFIESPGKHRLCAACAKRQGCDEKLEMCTPIKLKQDIIGVIGLICFTEQQKEHLLGDLDVYRQFLEQVAEFISIKAHEYQEVERNALMMKLLNQIIENMGKGVLILNKENKIMHINGSASKQLSLNPDCIEQKIQLEATGDSILGAEEFKVNINDKVHYVVGDLIAVTSGVSEYSAILIFNDIRKVKTGIYELTNIAEDIRLGNIIGTSDAMQQVKKKILKIADSKSTVLITGESGTGKEIIARAIHAESNRRTNPFVAINCGAIPDTLLESELFGYVKGAFTGADPRGKIGKFELANKGVIFLDEVGDMPLYLQVKILRVLQERKITRIGSNQQIDIDVRVVAATNKEFSALIKENKFREDLYYRLNVIRFEVPPLRERKQDIAEIALHLFKKYCHLFNKKITGIDEDVMRDLVDYPWPGNVRELENTIEFMINMVDEDAFVTREALPKNILEYQQSSTCGDLNQIQSLSEMERMLIGRALEAYGSSTEGKRQAAKKLGIGIATFYRKLEEYNLSK